MKNKIGMQIQLNHQLESWKMMLAEKTITTATLVLVLAVIVEVEDSNPKVCICRRPAGDTHTL
jgi:hypothetical protein